MSLQSLPDEFYYLLFAGSVCSAMMVARTLSLLVLWWSPRVTGQTQGKRYFVVAVGILVPALFLGVLLRQYGLDGVRLGLRELGGSLAFAIWVLLWAQVVSFGFSVLAAIRFAVRPVGYIGRERKRELIPGLEQM